MTARALRGRGPLAATLLVGAVLYAAAGLLCDGLFSPRVAAGIFVDNAFLGIAAVGVTFVILAGGIDLSIGAVVGCSSIMIATLVEGAGFHPVPAVLAALAFGAALGGAMGSAIHAWALPPFVVTLAGMFLARGLGFLISRESIGIRHALYADLSAAPVIALVFVAVVVAAAVVAHRTRFGRRVYALGGSEESARLMGLPVGPTRVAVYAASGFCAALAGAVYGFYTVSGNASAGTMLELDAIAAAVIGGTRLAGGAGSPAGTLLGVLVLGTIQTAIMWEGRLSPWWSRIAIGALLLGFILLQSALERALGRDAPVTMRPASAMTGTRENRR